MQTLRQVVSDLSEDIKALNIDDHLSYRYLANKFRDKVQIFFRQDARSREFLKISNIWKSIDCVDLKEVKEIDCACVGDECLSLKKSIIKLPDTYVTTYGNLIKVFTVDSNQEYHQIKSFQWKDQTTREYGEGKYFWLQDKHLFIKDSTLKSVKVFLIAKNPLEVDIINKCATPCASPLDAELNYPDYLIGVAKQEVLRELSGVTLQKVVDEKPNQNQNDKS